MKRNVIHKINALLKMFLINQLKNLEDFVIKNRLPFGLLINQAEGPYWLPSYDAE